MPELCLSKHLRSFLFSFLLCAAWITGAYGQTVSLALSSASAAPGSTVALNLSLTSPAGSEPAALQWAFSYSSTAVSSIAVSPGPAAVAAGKSISCIKGSGVYTCLLSGLNANKVANGVVAVVNLTLSSTSTTNAITLTNLIAASNIGNTITVGGTRGTITVAGGISTPVLLSGMSCTSTSLLSRGTSTCTVRLNQAAPAGGVVISLSDNNLLLTAPSSVTVAAGATSANFTVSAGILSSLLSVTLRATLGSSSLSVIFNLQGAATLSGLTCNPAALVSGASSVCTVMLSRASSGTTTVTLADNSSLLTTPASVAIANGASSATFSVRAGTINTAQSVTVTATLGGNSRAASLALQTAATVSALTCNPNMLTSGASSVCTVTLSRASSGTTTVTLADNNSLVTTPASVSIANGSTSATFSIRAGTINTAQSVAITATLGNSSRAASLGLHPATSISGLTCNPASLVSGASSVCTVTLSKVSSGTTTVTLADNSSLVTTPVSVTIANGAASATFSVRAGTINTAQSVTVTATLGGNSRAASLALQTATIVSALTCNPNALTSGASSICTVTLSRASSGTTTVTLADNSSLVTTPASVSVTNGATAAKFSIRAGTIRTAQSVTITATLGSSWRAASLGLHPATTISVTSLRCGSGRLTVASKTECTVSLAKSAPASGFSVQLATDSPALVIPKALQVPEGSATASFTVQADAVDKDQEGTIVAMAEESAQSAQISVQGIKPASLDCAPKQVAAGGAITCEVRLNSDQGSQALDLAVSSSSSHLLVPAIITTRPRQASLTFEADASPAANQESVTIQATLGTNTVEDTVILLPPGRPVLNLPGRQLVKIGTLLSFPVSATTASGDPAILQASGLPEGASFDAASGSFRWTPSQAQSGTYTVAFAAQDPAGASSSETVQIEADAGIPVATAVVNGASQLPDGSCSPGAIAILRGKWLTEEDSFWSDPTGASTQLGGVRVKVNDAYVPLLSASRTEVQFLCPALTPGTKLAISLETGSAITKPLTAVLEDVAPGIFTQNGSGTGQADTTFAGSTALAATRSYRAVGQPAQAGDRLRVRVTGIRPEDGSLRPAVRLGRVYTEVQSVHAAADTAGVYEIEILVPASTSAGEAIPLVVEVPHADGRVTESNTATITVEAVRQ